MPELSGGDLAQIRPLLEKLRLDLEKIAAGDPLRLHSMRRYVAKRLEFDERGTPMQRRKLKDLMWKKQKGICADCGIDLPESGAELDRVQALLGYTESNVRLVHHECHRKSQREKGYK